ncbi:MAG: RDD family protein [Pseudomonadota bacterium]
MTYSTPKFWRRLICLIYEFLLLLAILFIASFIFHLIFRDTTAAYFRPLFQFYLLIVMGYYFIWFWTHGGQTLAMQTWKMRIVDIDGSMLSRKKALIRYLLAVPGMLFFGVSIIWSLFDRDHQFLHDRLAGTRVTQIEQPVK